MEHPGKRASQLQSSGIDSFSTRSLLTFVASFLLFVPSIAFAQEGNFADGIFVRASCDLMGLSHNELGALMTAAGFFCGFIAAAFGGWNHIRAACVAAVGSYAIASVLSISFPTIGCDIPGRTARENVARHAYSVGDTSLADASAAETSNFETE